jgi:hypothetical protein
MEVHKIYIVFKIVGGLTSKIKQPNYVYNNALKAIFHKIKLHNVLKNVTLVVMQIQQQKDVLLNVH